MNSGSADSAMTSPMGPGTPESPFSPEIQNILDDEGMSGAGVSGGMSSVFRSHSVPVQDMLSCAGKYTNYSWLVRVSVVVKIGGA